MDLDHESLFFPALLQATKVLLHKKNHALVSGPITTGGFGNRFANLRRLEAAVVVLQAYDHAVFNQGMLDAFFSGYIDTLWDSDEYCMPILESFYLPLFEEGYITKLYFLPDWQTSIGAAWEHDQALKLGIEMEYLSEDFLKKHNI